MSSTRRLSLALTSAFIATATANAQQFTYPNFTSTSGLTLNGSAAVVGGVLRVTPAAGNQLGSVWRSQPVNVVGGFTSSFTFQFTSPFASGADGLAFVLQNDPRGTAAQGTGLQGSAIGYGDNLAAPNLAIKNSLVLEVDTYDAGVPWNDPSGAHLSWHTNGTAENNGFESQSIGLTTPSVDFTDGQVHSVGITYTPTPGTLDVKYDGVLVLSVPYNFATGGTWTAGGAVGGLNLIGGTSLYVGFTSATGGAWENNDLLDWSFSGSVSAPVVYCTSGTSSSGCAASISAANNPSVSLANPCNLSVSGVDGQKNGILFYGLTQLIQPWATGSSSYLCTKTPTQRSLSQSSGGTLGQCNGSFALDWNAFQSANPTALGNPWTAGATANCQAWYRDPPAPKTTNLSNAVQLTYQP